MNRIIQYYSTHADRFFQRYENLPFEKINSLWIQFIPPANARILDVGAGSGRDASWLARKGHDVIAIEPADGLRELARKKHLDQPIQWVNDRLPEIQLTKKLRLQFELILMNAVWMHIAPRYREAALNNLIGLLKTGGNLVMTLRDGPSTDEREMYPVSREELMLFAETKRLELILDAKSDDLFGRTDVSWQTVVFRMPYVEI